jgi:HAD superfamily hydrolase (TIGR01490 family)
MQQDQDHKRGAFFDVDYTLLAGNSVSLFVKFMRQEGKVGAWEIVSSLYYLAQYRLNLLDFERVAAREVAKLAGQPESEMIALCNRWFEEMVIARVYREGEAAIAEHQARGDVVVLLSAASAYLVGPLARFLNVEHYLCNRMEVDGEGKFTGRARYPLCYGAGKVQLAEGLAAELGLDLGRSVYYSDSITDLPVLERFGEARVVNPDRLLRREARKRGWPMLAFRQPRGVRAV